MDIRPLLKKYAFPLTAVALIWLVVLLLVFKAGLDLGLRKGAFTCQWSENYHKNFGGPPPGGLLQMIDRDDSVQAHGVFGTVIQTATGTLIVKQNDGVEKLVNVGDDTVIQLMRQRVPIGEVHVSETVVVIGEPNEQGQIDATFVRILPPPPVPARGSTAPTR